MISPYFVGYVSIRHLPSLKEEDIKKSEIINLAFGHIKDGIIVSELDRYQDDLMRIKEINPDVRLLLSVGGWGAGGFSEAASSPETRARLIASSLEHMDIYGLDGIDLDWEYPCIGIAGIEASPEDKWNFTYLLKEFREAIAAAYDNDRLLTIAAAGDEYYIHCTEMDEVQGYVDYVQLMTYDLRGGFTVQTGHHTNLYSRDSDLSRASAKKAVDDYIAAGVPREKIVMGVAFYSRVWRDVPNRNSGLMQMAGTTGGYGPDYHELVDAYIDKNGYIRHWDDESKAPYLFNGESFISYDDTESLEHKIDFVEQEGLGGIMYWEYGSDQTGSLLDVLYQSRRKAVGREIK